MLISLLLNRISLAPGEAVYLPAGNVHAYLHGLGIEVMASSDNVLRGGLTPKFVDVPELLKTIAFEAVGVPMLAAETTLLGQELFRPPFREFQLQRIELEPGAGPVPLAQSGAAVIIVVAGSVLLDSPKGDLHLDRGGERLPARRRGPGQRARRVRRRRDRRGLRRHHRHWKPEPVEYFLQSPAVGGLPAVPGPHRP